MKRRRSGDHNLDIFEPNQPSKNPIYWKTKLIYERESLKKSITERLRQQRRICLTINIMADRYYAMTASYLDEGFVRKTHYIAVDEIGEKNWWETIDGICTEYGLSASQVSNVVAGFDLLPSKRELPSSMKCIASKLDEFGLAVYMKQFHVPSMVSAFEIVHRIAYNLKIVCNLTRQNRGVADLVKEIFGESLIVPDSIDWKSKLIENSSQKRQQLPNLFDYVCKKCHKDHQIAVDFLFIEEFQWQFLEEFCLFTKIIKDAINNLLKMDNSSLGDVLPTLFAAKLRIEQKPNSKMKEYVVRYFQKIFNAMMDLRDTGGEKSNRDYILAAISNPKYKLAWVPDDVSEFLKTIFINECQLNGGGSNKVHLEDMPGPSTLNSDDFVSIILKTNSHSNRKNQEANRNIQEYLRSETTKKLNVLKEYPTVEKVFRKYNTTVSFTPVERLLDYVKEYQWPREQLVGDRLYPKDLMWAFKDLN